MKKIMSVVLVAALFGTISINGMSDQPNNANGRPLDGSAPRSNFVAAPNPSARMSWTRAARVALWGTSSATLGVASAGFGVASCKLFGASKTLASSTDRGMPFAYQLVVNGGLSFSAAGFGLTAAVASAGCGFASWFCGTKALQNWRGQKQRGE